MAGSNREEGVKASRATVEPQQHLREMKALCAAAGVDPKKVYSEHKWQMYGGKRAAICAPLSIYTKEKVDGQSAERMLGFTCTLGRYIAFRCMEVNMTNREHFQAIMAHKSDRCGFWHGSPHQDSRAALYSYFDVFSNRALARKLGDTFDADVLEGCEFWQHPDGAEMFDVLGGMERHSLGQAGVFADCEDVAEVERFHWPEIKYCSFSAAEKVVDESLSQGQAVLSGSWAPFFHILCDFFGMENYFIKMYTDPAVVEAVTEHVVDFFLQVHEQWFRIIGDRMDAIFFGNDFGSQIDTLISPEMFDKFVLPHFKRITEQAKRGGYKVVLHSCGAIERVIPRLIDAGVDALHPVQAKARGMDAETLAKKYKDQLVFIGGVDTQALLPFGTPREVRDEVLRIKGLFGPNYIVSPSHEALLPNVPPENVEAMAETARA